MKGEEREAHAVAFVSGSGMIKNHGGSGCSFFTCSFFIQNSVVTCVTHRSINGAPQRIQAYVHFFNFILFSLGDLI
jgi:hypothetical protein